MKYALYIAMREFAENVRTKGFWVGLLMFPVILVLAIKVPQLLEEKATPTRNFVLVDASGRFEDVVEKTLERRQVRRTLKSLAAHGRKHGRLPEGMETPDLEKIPAVDLEGMLGDYLDSNPEVVDAFLESGGLETALSAMAPFLVEDAPPFEEPRRLFRRVELPANFAADGDPDSVAQSLRPFLLGEESLAVDGESVELFAAILIPEDVDAAIQRGADFTFLGEKGGIIQYWASNQADQDLRKWVEAAINAEVRRVEYETHGMDSEAVRKVENTRIPITRLNPRKDEGEEEVSMADLVREWAPLGFVYLLWVALMTIAQMLLNNTIEEKSNRIIEVLLSSVTTTELMAGKLMGIAGVGLTMLLAWVLSLVGVLSFMAGPEAEWADHLLDILASSGFLTYFLLYFLLGYLLYAGIFLAIGSVCNTLKEAQNFMGAIMIFMMVPLLTMAFIPKDPHGPLATTLSWIPFYTPFVMMNRAAADPPLFDLIGTTVVLALSVVGMLWVSARVFRTGILRTGQPPRLLELLRWIRG